MDLVQVVMHSDPWHYGLAHTLPSTFTALLLIFCIPGLGFGDGGLGCLGGGVGAGLGDSHPTAIQLMSHRG